MAKHFQKKKRRRELWEQDPHCYWCGCETVLYHKFKGGDSLPNQATLEHLYDRLDPRRADRSNRGPRYVLSCYECNWKRGLKRQQEEQARGNPLAFDSDKTSRYSVKA